MLESMQAGHRDPSDRAGNATAGRGARAGVAYVASAFIVAVATAGRGARAAYVACAITVAVAAAGHGACTAYVACAFTSTLVVAAAAGCTACTDSNCGAISAVAVAGRGVPKALKPGAPSAMPPCCRSLSGLHRSLCAPWPRGAVTPALSCQRA